MSWILVYLSTVMTTASCQQHIPPYASQVGPLSFVTRRVCTPHTALKLS